MTGPTNSLPAHGDGAGWVVGVDSGGTFTDLVAVNRASGAVHTTKVPSTPDDPVAGVENSLNRSALEQISRFIHGTTVATNAVLQRRGARLCLITTAGFEDVPFIQRLNRPLAYSLDWSKPQPFVERERVIGLSERIDANGRVIEPLSEPELRRAVSSVAGLVAEEDVEAVAICLLFSYANDRHERLLRDALIDALPGIPVSTSSGVSPLWREYERVSTTLADAYVSPLVASYLTNLTGSLSSKLQSPLLTLKSNGGTAIPASIAPKPVTLLLSGLAGGALGGSYFGAEVGDRACITFDMGGTSTDIGLVRDGFVAHFDEYEIEWGIPVVTPVVDVRPIGAGGGSIARVDKGGLLVVGPESAGANPGPACYGLGGRDATVTDANLVLGRLNPAYFLGGELKLDDATALRAIEGLGSQLGLSGHAAARAVVDIATENMANGIRLIAIDRGLDLRDHALVAFGGAGPLHACAVADAVDIRRVVVPPNPGLCSAFGAAIAPLRVDRVWSLGSRSDSVVETELRQQIESVEREVVVELEADGLDGPPLVRRYIACRYYLQNHEEDILIDDLRDGFIARLCENFHRRFRAVYGYAFDGEPIELVHAKVEGTERATPTLNPPPTFYGTTAIEQIGTRPVVVGDRLVSDVPVFRRGVLTNSVIGPAVIEEPDSTTYLPGGWHAQGAPGNCIVATRLSGR